MEMLLLQGLYIYTLVFRGAADFSSRKVLLTMEMLLLPNECSKDYTQWSLVGQQTSLQTESSARNGDVTAPQQNFQGLCLVVSCMAADVTARQ